MATLEIGLPNSADWIRKFNPEKRLLKGRYYLAAKRAMDISIAVISIPFWLPLIITISIAILITSGWPIFFVQLRTGKGGRRFFMYKFRTMVKNAEAMKKEIAAVNANGELAGPLKLKNDPRVTPIGKILRKTSLDELPQILNIILGNMSFVGPRPTSWSLASYKLWHTERLDVLPGLTGLWQIYGRGGEDFDEWLRWDIRYIEKRSIWFDFLILIKTATTFLRQAGAR
jgi:lipopolysaccharide/colanic/teichoic acid biosynthesis glycosyltransferase